MVGRGVEPSRRGEVVNGSPVQLPISRVPHSSGGAWLYKMIWVPLFVCSLAFACGHEAHRGGGRIRFPFDGPPPPPPLEMQLFTNPPRIFGAESQSHPIFHESPPPFSHHVPFSLMQQVPIRANPFGDGGPLRGGDTGFAETAFTSHQAPNPGGQHANRRPTRTKEGAHHFYHETQPPPFVTPPTLMTSATGGSQRIKISGHPSSHPSNNDEPQRHRFGPNRHSGHNERRPSGHRPPPPPGHQSFQPTPPSTYEYEPTLNTYDRYPPNDGPRAGYQGDSRPRPQLQDKPGKGAGERYPSNRERFPPGPSEKPFVYKEKAKTPFNGIKKPLFSPSMNQDKAVYKQQPAPMQGFRSQPQTDYPRPTPTEEDGDFYRAKLKEEYYSGVKQNSPQTDYPASSSRRYPASTHPQAPSQPGPTKPSNGGDGGFAFNEPFQFDAQYFGGQNDDPGSVSGGNSQFPPNLIPQSEEFSDFFDGSMPDWMSDFKSEDGKSGKGTQSTNTQRLHTQETQRQPYQQGQQAGQNYFDEEYSNAADQNKYVKKRNPNKQQSGEFYGNEEKRYYPKTQTVQKSEKRPLPDSYYDVPDSSEFDFGSSSEFNMQDFNIGSFNYGQEQKPAGSEWIPINAPSGAIPAKSYDIPAPDLSPEQYPGHRQQPLRRQLSDESLSDLAEKSTAVVYGARERKRQNEGVVSASVMVKQ